MFQQIILVGYLGRDPEMRFTDNGDAVTNFSVATNRSWKDKDGNKQEETIWHNVSVWGNQAGPCHEYLHKSDPVLVIGQAKARAYLDKNDGTPRSSLDVRASSVQFLPKGGEKAAAAAFGGGDLAEVPF